ncbi:DedA family protein [Williamsia deligens]|uniref:DedA family protein n=1 Tax=Williamsia deligens TaxID=321325 RepID=A0ABW3GB65_9NOCA|nr:DedA family protein [Williamsia deligens]MCP2196110.1 membrane protein DedA, SNARE-associated domain [Williamsia deligens]
MTALTIAATDDHGFTGITGFAADVLERFGSVGIGFLVFLETVFPPIPSEVILPFAGYLSHTGALSLAGLVLWSTVGAWVGAVVLYVLGRFVGLDRTVDAAVWTRVVSRRDAERGADWFRRFGTWSVFLGRMIPGVRSIISLPAGAAAMNLLVFSALTLVGSFLWNGLLLGAGAALGTQHERFHDYLGYFDYVVYAVIAAAVATLIVRRRRHQREDAAADAVVSTDI